jgi:hypothetical protein
VEVKRGELLAHDPGGPRGEHRKDLGVAATDTIERASGGRRRAPSQIKNSAFDVLRRQNRGRYLT